jgi:N-acetylglucosaminyldiphosphoundecaprenol N-acetyl-beta-D-mannosaminyltransferase
MNSSAVPIIDESASFPVLGVRVDAVQIPDAIARIEAWATNRDGCHYVVVADMHVISQAKHDPGFRKVLDSADFLVPDGTPLVWIGRLHGHALRRRVSGPELMLSFFDATARKGFRHFFYGGAPGIPELLAENLQKRFPGTIIAGTYSPPFRQLTAEEDSRIMDMIRQAHPDVVWVGLGAPKQERWMYEHRDRLGLAVLIGVGAAFDLHAGTRKQAPVWMRENGFEWLFRLFQEPQRLWRRYLLHGSKFVYWATLEMLTRKKHS